MRARERAVASRAQHGGARERTSAEWRVPRVPQRFLSHLCPCACALARPLTPFVQVMRAARGRFRRRPRARGANRARALERPHGRGSPCAGTDGAAMAQWRASIDGVLHLWHDWRAEGRRVVSGRARRAGPRQADALRVHRGDGTAAVCAAESRGRALERSGVPYGWRASRVARARGGWIQCPGRHRGH